jgi:hypothetical protein
MSTSQGKLQVYNRRFKMDSMSGSNKEGETRDWAGLPPKVLKKVFESLQVFDLHSVKETCKKWKVQVEGAYQFSTMLTWSDTIDSILQNMHRFNHVKDVDVEIMKAFLVREVLDYLHNN